MKANCTRCFLSSRASSTSLLVAELENWVSLSLSLNWVAVCKTVRSCERAGAELSGGCFLSAPARETVRARDTLVRDCIYAEGKRTPGKARGKQSGRKGEGRGVQSGLVDEEDVAGLPVEFRANVFDWNVN